MPKKRYPLPKRFTASLSETAYRRLRDLNAEFGLGNNYLLTVLLENLDEIMSADRLEPIRSGRRLRTLHCGVRRARRQA